MAKLQNLGYKLGEFCVIMNRVHGFVLTNSTPPSPAVCQGVGVSAQRDRNWSYSIRQSGSEWFSSGFT